MKLLKYSNSIEIEVPQNIDMYVESIKKKIGGKLKDIDAKSEDKNGEIKFKRIVRNTTHSGMNKVEALKIIREGVILVEKRDLHKIQISWKVKLDTLLILSIMVGIVIVLIAGFATSDILNSMVAGILFSIVIYAVGYSIIRVKIDRIINASI